MAASVIKTDVGCSIVSQPVLTDLVDLGGGITAYQLKTAGGGLLPAAVALSDALANPTTPMVGSCVLAWDGTQFVRVRVPSISKDQSTVDIGMIATVWTPAGGKKVRFTGGSISVSADVSILFEDNIAGVTVFRTPKLVHDTPYNFVVRGGQGYLLAAANNVLKATASGAATLLGTLDGTEE